MTYILPYLRSQKSTNPTVTTNPTPIPPCPTMPATDEDDYGDELVYDSELDETLRVAEAVPDIEDVPAEAIAPFEEFRRRGNLSVSDLVGTVWCEVQFD